jgi:hypothetical protein
MPLEQDEDDALGMDEALERAHADGGADTFGVIAALEGREPEAEPEGEMVLPEMDFSGPPAVETAEQRSAVAPDVVRQRQPQPQGKPPASSLDWKGLADRLGWANIGRGDSKAYESLFANVGAQSGYKPNAHAGEVLTQTAKLPLDMAKERQGYEARDLSIQAQRDAMGVKSAMSDPNSLQSQKARDSVRAFFGDVALPAGFDNWSAEDVQKFANTGQLSLVERRKALSEEARKREEALERERLRKAGLDERYLDERIRHNKAMEPRRGTAGPAAKIEAGKIETVPERRPGYRQLVEGIADGRLEAPRAGSRFGAELVSDVLAYKPDFDATRFNNYAAVGKQQAVGKDVVAIDVGLEHLATARKLIPRNADTTYVNKVKQAIASGTGDPEFKPYVAASTVAAHELAKIYGIEDQAGKEMVEHQLAAVQSPEQLAAVFDTFIELVEGKQKGLQKQLQRVAPGGGKQAAHGHGPKEPLKTRKTKSGETAYQSRTSGRWFTTPEEAEAN